MATPSVVSVAASQMQQASQTAEELVQPPAITFFRHLCRRGEADDLRILLDIWPHLARDRLVPGAAGPYAFDGLGYDVGAPGVTEDEQVYPIHVVAANSGDLDMFKLLLQHGAEPMRPDGCGRTVLDLDSNGKIAQFLGRYSKGHTLTPRYC